MNSTTALVAKQCRLETWAQQIQDCNQRPQGMSVKEWCSQQGVNVASYYGLSTLFRTYFIRSILVDTPLVFYNLAIHVFYGCYTNSHSQTIPFVILQDFQIPY